MKPIQYYIGILSVLGYVYCLPVVGQVEDKVVRKGNPRLEYTDVKTGRSPEGKMFTVSFNIVESINRLRTQEIVYRFFQYSRIHQSVEDTGNCLYLSFSGIF